MSASGLDAVALAAASAAALGASVVLVVRLERLAARWGVSEAMLGVLVALAADTPEITSAVTALARGQTSIGAGVVLGSNVFNLAALLGLSAVVAGGIALHRRVVAFEGVPALWIAGTAVLVAAGTVASGVGLGLVAVVVVPYLVVVAGVATRRGRPSGAILAWLRASVADAEQELAPGVHPRPAGHGDGVLALVALAVVVGASVVMEHSAAALGAHAGISALVTGAVVLAAVTSLPNAVGAVYLARRGRGSAVLSEATNSNMLNVLVGLLVPSVLLGATAASSDGRFVAIWYVAMTALCVGVAALQRGVRRTAGVVIVLAYVAFVVSAIAR
jgi:cation:H+ antiporter